jgi:hypothetical protein
VANTSVAVQIATSGIASYEGVPEAAIWASGSTLISSLLASTLNITENITAIPSRETVFLTRAHQRIMDRALRRSVRIIA